MDTSESHSAAALFKDKMRPPLPVDNKPRRQPSRGPEIESFSARRRPWIAYGIDRPQYFSKSNELCLFGEIFPGEGKGFLGMRSKALPSACSQLRRRSRVLSLCYGAVVMNALAPGRWGWVSRRRRAKGIRTFDMASSGPSVGKKSSEKCLMECTRPTNAIIPHETQSNISGSNQ